MRLLKPAILLFVSLTLLTGGLYPLLVTAIGQLAFPEQAAGSLIRKDGGTLVGSGLIGQPFDHPRYFWPRPSATADFPYNPLASGGSNLGPTNPDLLKQVAERVRSWEMSGLAAPVPAELVLASGSGLDPHISLEGALLQVPRLARVRQVPLARLRQLVQDHLEDRQLGFLGAPRVNVLKLNLALDEMAAHGTR